MVACVTIFSEGFCYLSRKCGCLHGMCLSLACLLLSQNSWSLIGQNRNAISSRRSLRWIYSMWSTKMLQQENKTNKGRLSWELPHWYFYCPSLLDPSCSCLTKSYIFHHSSSGAELSTAQPQLVLFFSYKMVGRFLKPTEQGGVANDGDCATWFCDSMVDNVDLESRMASLRMWMRKLWIKNSLNLNNKGGFKKQFLQNFSKGAGEDWWWMIFWGQGFDPSEKLYWDL